jgi:hypothetical protein
VGFFLSTGWNEFVCGPFVSFWEKKKKTKDRKKEMAGKYKVMMH